MSALIERRKIVEMWRQGHAVALATLVRVEGSSYRTVGARLLVGKDGTYTGSVSGGCLEAELVRKAQWLVRKGAVVERYSTLFDDTADIPYGLGCGGTVDILIESAKTPECAALMEAIACSLDDQPQTVQTWLPQDGQPLIRRILRQGGEQVFLTAEAPGTLAPAQFEEYLDVPHRLFLFGAGDDAQPMARFAALLGWTVYVFDGRPQWARPERFPEAHVVTCSTRLSTPRPGPGDAVILMTHSYEQDRSWLEQVLPLGPRYLGLLGSRHRSALLVAEAAQSLQWPLQHACERLFSPVGLDLGGDGAEAIALSAIAEIQACMQGKLGHSRRMTPETVYEQIQKGGPSRYLQTQCAL